LGKTLASVLMKDPVKTHIRHYLEIPVENILWMK